MFRLRREVILKGLILLTEPHISAYVSIFTNSVDGSVCVFVGEGLLSLQAKKKNFRVKTGFKIRVRSTVRG